MSTLPERSSSSELAVLYFQGELADVNKIVINTTILHNQLHKKCPNNSLGVSATGTYFADEAAVLTISVNQSQNKQRRAS